MTNLLNRQFLNIPLYKHLCALFVSASFLMLRHWSVRHTAGYFLEWLSRQTLWRAWIIAVILIYLGQWLAGLLLAAGHWAGIPFAQVVGDRLYAQAQALLPDNPTFAQFHQAQPKHAFLWWGSIAVLTILGFLLQLIFKIIRKKRNSNKSQSSRRGA